MSAWSDLKRAAGLMRERAEAVDDENAREWDGWNEWLVGSDAPHIASWRPAVALAVADWLDDAAEWVANRQGHLPEHLRHARAVADAYLNEPPETYAERLARQGDE